jgi:hypothetical protein
MAATYGLDLRDELWGAKPIGLRRLLALVANLPPDSALHRVLDPYGVGAGWGWREELLAAIAQLVDHSNRLFVSANSKKGAKVPRPIAIPRPGDRARERRQASGEEVAAMTRKLGGMIVPARKAED